MFQIISFLDGYNVKEEVDIVLHLFKKVMEKS